MPQSKPVVTLPSPPPPVHPFDEIYQVDTGGLIPAAALASGHPSDPYITAYYAVAPSIVRALIATWLTLDPVVPIGQTTFLDAGAGKGRAMLVASQLGFHDVLGIELNPALAAIAEANVIGWRQIHAADPTAYPLAPILLLEGDVLTAAIRPRPTVVFLFHPFEAPLLRRFLRRLEALFTGQKKAHPRGSEPATLDLLYVNAEHAAVLDEHPAFTRLFTGRIAMSPEDHAADLEAIATQQEYGSTGDEECAIYRLTGRNSA